MVRGIEDLRTPLSKIIKLDKELRGTLSGFMMPAFVIDLPGGGGKRLVSTYETYDEETGVATYAAPGLPGVKGTQVYTYHDPKAVTETAVQELRHEQEQALEQDISLEDFTRSTVPQPGPPMPLSGIFRPHPPFIYQHSPPRTPSATSVRQSGIKPADLAPHIAIDTWQPSAAAA
jgi:lysine 2,3-aminomutase